MILEKEYKDIFNRGMCDEYISLWNKAENLRDIYGLLTKSESIRYYNRIPWLTSTYIKEKLPEYINKEVYEQDGYGSILYCDCYDNLLVPREATIVIMLNSHCKLVFEDYSAKEVYLVGYTNDVTFKIPEHSDIRVINLDSKNLFKIENI